MGAESGLGGLDDLKCEVSMSCANSIIRMCLHSTCRTECSCQLITAPSAPDRVGFSVPQLCVDIQSLIKRFFVHRSWLGYSSLGIFFILNLDGHCPKCLEYMERKFANIPYKVAFCKWLTYPFYTGVFIHFILKNSLQNLGVSYSRLLYDEHKYQQQSFSDLFILN